MKHTLFLLGFALGSPFLMAQDIQIQPKHRQQIIDLIDQYQQARETKDSRLLENILTTDIDQLVSSGEWRDGKTAAMEGMMRSSSNNPGTRTLTVEKIRFLDDHSAIVDARYEIRNDQGATRKMWSTFVVVYDGGTWKISAIRNMLPSGQQ